jgi:hypothetical protein
MKFSSTVMKFPNDVLHQRVDDLGERAADDHADRQVDHVALHRELPEFAHHAHRALLGLCKKLHANHTLKPSVPALCRALAGRHAFSVLREFAPFMRTIALKNPC